MIKNTLEYRITEDRIVEFELAIQELIKNRNQMDQIMFDLHKDSLESQVIEMKENIQEYKDLKKSKKAFLINNIEDIFYVLIKARIASGYTQEEMAKELKLDLDTYMKYENNNFEGVEIAYIAKLIEVLKLETSPDIDALISVSKNDLIRKISDTGLNSNFLMKRIYPERLSEISDTGLLNLLSSIQKIFKFKLKDLLNNTQLSLNIPNLQVKYKLPESANKNDVEIYTSYAYYIAELALKATDHLQIKDIPNNPKDFYFAVQTIYGDINFENVLRFTWDLGICVLPLNDNGMFHGAFWRRGGRNVIVLKQKVRQESRWLFDLLHELWHAAQEPEKEERTIIDFEDENQLLEHEKEERVANKFAANIVLSGKAEYLVQQCIDRSNGKIPYLKKVVQEVANEENVPVGGLANYLARRLSLQNQNWWGVANNLQTGEQNPWELCRDVFFENIDLDALDESEQLLLSNALFEGEEV